MSNLKPLYVDGNKRFKCECGAVMTMAQDDAGAAIEHTFHGHKVAIEEFRNGKWRYQNDGTNGTRFLADLILERMRARGENPQALIRRLNEESERLKAAIELKEADKVN